MDKNNAIVLIKQALTNIPHLRELRYDGQEFKLWLNKVETIIKHGLDTDDYDTLLSARPSSYPMRGMASESKLLEYYQDKITSYDTSLKSIIQKYEILGIETEPAVIEEQKDSIELPLHVFDSMQFHPKVIEASRELFEDGHYIDAILRAFIAVNNSVKAKTGLELDGKALMTQVFRKENPVIRLNESKTQSEKDEQEGFMFLFMGAMVGIRNPKAHDNIIQTDPLRTLEYLALASLLIRRAEEGTS